MGVTNFDNLQQNIVQTRIREAQQIAIEQKGSLQQISGNNIRYFSVTNPGEFAWSGRMPDEPAPVVGAIFSLILTSSNQTVPLSDLAVEVFTSTNGESWTEAPHQPNFADPNDPLITYTVEEIQRTDALADQSKWILILSAVPRTWLAFKAFAYSTDETSMSITRTM